ncbi:MAG: carboxypeptidase-like regulatory domain-containing protein [Vicinamibacterales bacterium]
MDWVAWFCRYHGISFISLHRGGNSCLPIHARFELLLDGFFMHGGPVAGVPRVPLTIRGDRRQQVVETDDQGHFMLVGLEPGIYEIEPRLPKPYEPLFDRPVSVKLDGCLAEAYIVVASVPLSGEARNADGSLANEHVMLRVAHPG